MMSETYTFVEGKLVNQFGQSVMMDWERPIMKKVSDILCSEGKRILNIGFGMGIVDTYIQEYKPDLHVIVENNPVVEEKMRTDGWYSKPNVMVVYDRWQNVLEDIGEFDSIYLDTWNDHRVKYINTILDSNLKVGGKFLMWYNKFEFDKIVSNLSENYSVSYEYVPNDNIIPPANQQYEKGGFYIDPELENITIPIITKLK